VVIPEEVIIDSDFSLATLQFAVSHNASTHYLWVLHRIFYLLHNLNWPVLPFHLFKTHVVNGELDHLLKEKRTS